VNLSLDDTKAYVVQYFHAAEFLGNVFRFQDEVHLLIDNIYACFMRLGFIAEGHLVYAIYLQLSMVPVPYYYTIRNHCRCQALELD
jgi:hypothetical protein